MTRCFSLHKSILNTSPVILKIPSIVLNILRSIVLNKSCEWPMVLLAQCIKMVLTHIIGVEHRKAVRKAVVGPGHLRQMGVQLILKGLRVEVLERQTGSWKKIRYERKCIFWWKSSPFKFQFYASRSFARKTCVDIDIIFTQVGNNRYITPTGSFYTLPVGLRNLL